jgi:hypothetical protein
VNGPVEQREAASSPWRDGHRSSSPPPLPPAAAAGSEKITRDLPPALARPLRGAGRAGWVPPGPVLRWSLVAGVLIAAVTLARRWPIGPDGSSREIAGAREVVGYQLGGQPITLALPPGTTVYKVATNLDLPAGMSSAPRGATTASDLGVPYVVRVRVPEDGRDEAFALLGRPALDATGRSTAFFRDRAGTPARTAVLTLRRTSTRPATLQVSLEPLGDAQAVQASLRVFVAHERIGAGPGPQRPPTVGGLALDDLDPEVRAAFLAQSWGRLPARSLTPTRTFYLPAAAASTPSFDRGHVVGAGHVLAVTVKGPGTVDVLAPQGWQGEMSLLYPAGQGRSWPLQSSEGPDPVSVAIGKGLCTLRISARDAAAPPVRVRLTVADPNMIVDDPAGDRSAERGDGRNEVGPTWSWQVVARAQPAGPPVIVQAAGRRQAAFRITAWAPIAGVAAGRSAAAAPRVRWRFVDARGAVLLQGKTALDAALAPEDHLEGGADAPEGGGLVSQPTTFHLWPPRAAHRLLIDADGAADVALASPGFDAQPFAPDADAALGPLADSIRLRHAHQDRRAFYPVRPLNATDLQRAGRLERLAGALRLERQPPRPPPKGAAVSLGPQRDGGRFVVLLPKTPSGPEAGAAGSPARLQGHLWAMRSQHDETVIVPRPRGTAGTARVPATLLYELARPSGRQPLVVRLDGQVIRRASLLGARGQVVLPPIAVGKHRLRIDVATPARLFFDQPVAGAAEFRRSQVYLLPAGAAGVAVDKGRAPRALGLVMYMDGPPPGGRTPLLDIVVDGGKRRRLAMGASTAFTRLRRIEELAFARAPGAVYLNRRAGAIWESRPIFVPLGDDLTAGTHRVSLHARGLGARGRTLAARFFSYGGPQINHINQHVEMSVDVAPDRGSEALP